MFFLYKSSAGSGKTFTLVKEYLKICLVKPYKFSRILAITFTNKAAAEMKLRIINSIHNFLQNGKDDIVDLVISETDLDRETAVTNAAVLRSRLLHSYNDFSVMTIDSFIGNIVRTFAHDLDMPLKFDVELDQDRIITNVIDNLIDKASQGNYVGDILTKFLLMKIQATGSWVVDTELQKIGKVTFNEQWANQVTAVSSPDFDEDFWKSFIASISDNMKKFQMHINNLALQALEIIKAHDLSIDDFPYKMNGAAGALLKYSKAANPDDFEITTRFGGQIWMAKSTPAAVKDKIEAALSAGLEKISHEIIDFSEAGLTRYRSHRIVYRNIFSVALINQFIKLTEEYNKETNSVPLADFSRKVTKVVREETVPFLYWRLGNKYYHILVDEFQDTSGMQWTNFLPLISESLANGNFNMAVGDGKQSIYRWRAGDVTIMEQQLPRDLGYNLVSETLQNNFRSRLDIVKFNNDLFSHVKNHLTLTDNDIINRLYAGENVTQNPVNDQRGYVKISLVDTAEAGLKSEIRNCILEALYADIQNIIDSGSGYNYEDIAILVRAKRHAVIIAQFLFERGIEVISPASLLLKNSEAVRFVINAMRYTVRNDKISLFSMWQFLGRDPAEFMRLTELQPDFRKIEELLSSAYMAAKPALLQRPVYEFAEEIIRLFSLNTKYHGFLQGLLELILNNSEKYNSDINSFLEWWEENSDSDKAALSSGQQTNAVKITTIHKSKGLEFPIVFMPFDWELIEKSGGSKGNVLWVKNREIGNVDGRLPLLVDMQKGLEKSLFLKEYQQETALSLLDNINLLYVALTRAADRLYLYLPEQAIEKQNKLENINSLIQKLLPELNLQAGDGCLTAGEPSQKDEKQSESGGKVLRQLPSTSWRKKITVKKRAAELWRLESGELKSKIDRGVLIHEILAGIEVESDVKPAVEEQFRLGHISSSEKLELTTVISGIMDIPLADGMVGDWFQSGLKIMNERTIAAAKGEFRPDRVIIRQKEAVVIDYKTGRYDLEHEDQIKRYGEILAEMGYAPVSRYLLYLQTNEVKEI